MYETLLKSGVFSMSTGAGCLPFAVMCCDSAVLKFQQFSPERMKG